MADTYWSERIATLKAIIAAYDTAILEFATNGNLQSYTLDTGQTRQNVQRSEVSSLKNVRRALLSELDDLMARCDGGGSYKMPGW